MATVKSEKDTKALNNKKADPKKDMAKKQRACVILFILQLVGAVLLTVSLISSDMIPAVYLLALVSIEVILLVVSWELFFLRASESGPKALAARRIIAGIISIIIFAMGAVVAFALDKASDTLKEITSQKTVTTVVGVYVLKDDPAQNIADATDYDFGFSNAYDEKSTQDAIKSIKKEIGKSPKTEEYDVTMAMVDALYEGDVDAIILNESYASIVEDQEEYKDFSKETKLIYEYESTSLANSKDNKKSGDLSKFVVYLSGSDTRSKTLKVSRSDTNILMVVNTETKEILLVNTPRDYYVPTAASKNGARDKLTHCGIYGIDCSMKTLSNLYDLDIDYYAQINFTGFETLIDAIGGVTVHSDTAFTAYTDHDVHIQKGENHLNGKQALGFARDRHHQPGGDNDRGKNQMKVIAAVIDKLSAGTILSNYTDILESMEGMFVTDMTKADINALVKMQLKDMDSWDINSCAVTGSDGSSTTYSTPGSKAYVMYPDEESIEKVAELIDRVLDGEKLTKNDLK